MFGIFKLANIDYSCISPGQFNGYVSVTANGRICQQWTARSPHNHYDYSGNQFPELSVAGASNYCRSPGGEKYVWCYTTDPYLRWDICDVNLCGLFARNALYAL